MKKNTKVGTVVVDKVNEKIELYSKNEYNSIRVLTKFNTLLFL